jgi:hypothetical protein
LRIYGGAPRSDYRCNPNKRQFNVKDCLERKKWSWGWNCEESRKSVVLMKTIRDIETYGGKGRGGNTQWQPLLQL